MDDIFEHRIPSTSKPQLKKPEIHYFTLEQIMREDPLENVLNVGIRVEKVRNNLYIDAQRSSKKKLMLATVVYWFLLVYIVAALVWWFIAAGKAERK